MAIVNNSGWTPPKEHRKCMLCGTTTDDNWQTMVGWKNNRGKILTVYCFECSCVFGSDRITPELLRKAADQLEQLAPKIEEYQE